VKNFLENTEKKSESEKTRMIWCLTVVFMLLVGGLAVRNLGGNLDALSRVGLDLSQLPPAPDLSRLGAVKLAENGQDLTAQLERLTAADCEKRGEAYIAAQRLAGEDGFSVLKLQKTREEEDSVLLDYEHYYKGLPVLGSTLTLRLGFLDEQVAVAEDRLKRQVEVSVDPALSAPQAEAAAEAALGDESFAAKEGQLCIAEKEGKFHLAWRVVLEKGTSGEKQEVLIGALRGEALSAPIIRSDQTSNITR
jgi:hypothetical protein